MKKIIALISGCLITAASFAFDPNTKVLNAFAQTFKTAENVKWQDVDGNYSVSFIYSGTRSRITYDKDGNILGSTRYYEPSQLPLNIFTKLKKDNPSKELYGVTEVTVGEEMVYFVKMFDKKHWFTLKVDASGDSQLYEKFKKG